MPPVPKRAATRERVARAAGASRMEGTPLERIPELPKKPGGGKWHAFTVAMWRAIQASPMAGEYYEADLHGLYILADLVDQYWDTGDISLATEIRQQRQCFGLTPIDRRRLEWEIAKVEHAADRSNPPAESKRRVVGDPRAVLHAVS